MTDNPAIALRKILRGVMRDDAHIDKAWVAVLGANVGTLDFSLRHSEVVALWRQVYDLLFALPGDDEDRTQYLSYMGHYYTAIVHPDSWTGAGSSIANPLIVDQLTGIATTLQYRAIAAPKLGDPALSRLRDAITDWRAILDEAEFEEKFATELHAQVDHLEWLLDNVHLFGSGPIVESSKKLVGSGIAAMGVKPSFAKRIGKALAPALVVIAMFHTVTDDLKGITEGIADMKDAVVEIVTPPKQIEAPRTKELPAGKSETPESPTPEDGAQG